MKKIIALTLVLILAVGLFAGCKSSDKGSVYFLNFKPEADSAWQALAKTYTEKTGVTVKVVTAASGTYETTLTAEMAKKDAPTLFQCGNETALDTWKDYCLALDGTEFLNEMTTSDFNIKGEDGKTYCAGYCYEAFGIIVNTELLEKGRPLSRRDQGLRQPEGCCRGHHRPQGRAGLCRLLLRRSGFLLFLALLRPSGQYAAVL